MTDPRRRPRKPPQPSAPSDFRAAELRSDERSFIVMSYPLPAWEMPDVLTAAEKEVLRALLAGATARELAGQRGVSPRTIANQIASVFKKLGAQSRLELAARLARASPRARGAS